MGASAPRKNNKPQPLILEASKVRLQRLLAAAGLGSRRHCEALIEEGRVEVNGKVARLGMSVNATEDQIIVDGERLKQQTPVYYIVNKPVGFVSTHYDPTGRPRVVDLVPDRQRLFPVGRLDLSSEGLMLLTNDGELAQLLTHPRYGIAKTYHVVVAGEFTVEMLEKLRRGVRLAEGFAKVDHARIKTPRGRATELEVILSEGKNREIRRLLARLGHKVLALQRVAIGPLKLLDLPLAQYRPLDAGELQRLREAVAERAAEDAARPKSKRRRPSDSSSPRGKLRSNRSGGKRLVQSEAEGEPIGPSKPRGDRPPPRSSQGSTSRSSQRSTQRSSQGASQRPESRSSQRPIQAPVARPATPSMGTIIGDESMAPPPMQFDKKRGRAEREAGPGNLPRKARGQSPLGGAKRKKPVGGQRPPIAKQRDGMADEGRPATGRPATGRPATGRPATGRPVGGKGAKGKRPLSRPPRGSKGPGPATGKRKPRKGRRS
jgi:23S rRNA pseudouridine2605 synthase